MINPFWEPIAEDPFGRWIDRHKGHGLRRQEAGDDGDVVIALICDLCAELFIYDEVLDTMQAEG